MLYPTLLTLHNLNRWLVLALGLWGTWQVTQGWLRGLPWSAQYTAWVRLFAWLTSLQFGLGVALYLWPNVFIQVVLETTPWVQIMKSRVLRFFVLEHPVQMFLAIGLAHIALSTARRISLESRRYRFTALLLILAMVLILIAIPWPGLDQGRPWVRGF